MKRRSESSFGLHFDFHARPYPGRPPVGLTLKEEDIREICTLIRPDFIQIDCKGHPGWASYPTECGNGMPEQVQDTLALWRRVTKEEDVALYMHYSGVWDSNYITKYPEDAVMHADGTRSENATRTQDFSYADRLLIPQMCELAGKYGVDGIWIDGECWCTETDFDPRTVAAFEKETGIDLGGKLPANRGDAYFDEYRDYCRELFRRYVRHYTDAVHAKYPDFQIATNWGYTDHMPEPVTSDVDFLSGDFDPNNSFRVARYAARAIAQQIYTAPKAGGAWDLMAWNFRIPGHIPKHPVQMMQEAASVISVGGGFQNYITQYPDGAPRMEEIRRMKEVGDFVRARQDCCVRGRIVPECAILLSTYDRHLRSDGLFSRSGHENTAGLTALFCDTGYSVEIASEHTLAGRYDEYKCIVVPEMHYGLDAKTVEELLAYVNRGGSLLLVGKKTARMFADAGVPLTVSDTAHDTWRWVRCGDFVTAMPGVCSVGAPQMESAAFVGNEERSAHATAAAVLPFGNGKIGVIPTNLGALYSEVAQFVHRDLITAVCDRLYTPTVRIREGIGLAELVLTEKNEHRYIQILNANGQHANRAVANENFLPPIVDLVLSLGNVTQPKQVVRYPSGADVPISVEDGEVLLHVGRVDVHEILEIVE